ncbi:hypothetical protein RB614_09890 [Phytohabitans sp. ZYX-F-186]|uniref:Uncharacterized protein n=1 Tax=Phytohabitans maris TaxID=3071409 RepID=A0ABU0ZCP3_9ACTN|nr:hypothetical protein [Phytohabitans sp. ZYX-F-186]MDQ7904831.1 hypothetical protein [Phytohabitans sp. ZYX-F-186]
MTGKSVAGRARHLTAGGPAYGRHGAARSAAAGGVAGRYETMVCVGLVWPATAAR